MDVKRSRSWIVSMLAGCAAVGWLWAVLRFSAGLAELASRMPQTVFALVVGFVFIAGAVPGFYALKPEKRRIEPVREEEQHDTQPTQPAPAAAHYDDPEITAPPTASAPPKSDDKEYF